MKRWVKILVQTGICVAILIVVGAVSKMLIEFKPEAQVDETEEVKLNVQVFEAKKESVKLQLPTQGMVTPAKQSMIAAEVVGKVIKVDERFKVGGEFEPNEVMIEIDDSDYKAAHAEAKSRLADAKLALAQEEAQAERALRDWEELGLGGEPTDLVLRKPQLESAKARIEAAEAAVNKADRDTKRTKIRAPYKARVQRIHTELGSYLGPAAPIADIYAVSPFEVSLPLSLQDYAFVSPGNEEEGPSVALTTKIGAQQLQWEGEVVRETGEIDRGSRTIHLVAKVDAEENDLLQPGLFVQAEVEGVDLDEVVRVPLKAFYDLNTLVLVDHRDQLITREVTIIRRQNDEALITDGLDEGDRICITPLQADDIGRTVEIAEEEEAAGETETETPPLE
ncbi:MAG: efflux RND transporter periplasmic adaptor subunit [Verrucomicrobiota bacterium]